MRIVLVEDNEALADGIGNALRDHGHAVDWLDNGLEGDAYLKQEGADLAIVDVNLPGLSGFDLVRALRNRGADIPVIMLTARSGTDDRVAGLDAGADDYLIKPFEMAELAARIRALSRRRAALKFAVERVGELSFDRTRQQLSGPNGPINLPRRELALFEILLDHHGRLVAKDEIAQSLYGVGSDIEPNAVELLISRLRRKTTDCGVEIKTARGLGYLLRATPS